MCYHDEDLAADLTCINLYCIFPKWQIFHPIKDVLPAVMSQIDRYGTGCHSVMPLVLWEMNIYWIDIRTQIKSYLSHMHHFIPVQYTVYPGLIDNHYYHEKIYQICQLDISDRLTDSYIKSNKITEHWQFRISGNYNLR